MIKDCQTYQERFEQVKDEVVYNTCQYEYHSEILDKAINDMNNTEFDNFNNVAPNTNISISRTVLSRRSIVNYLVALTLEKKSSVISMICLMVYVFSLKIMMTKNFL